MRQESEECSYIFDSSGAPHDQRVHSAAKMFRIRSNRELQSLTRTDTKYKDGGCGRI